MLVKVDALAVSQVDTCIRSGRYPLPAAAEPQTAVAAFHPDAGSGQAHGRVVVTVRT